MLSIDLETRGGIRDFENIKVLVAGAIEFTRGSGFEYLPGKYESWECDEMDDFRTRLQDFDGIILGHNLFGFDYRVLANYFDVSALITRTLDFQYWLWRQGTGRVALGPLAEDNLRQRKVAGSVMSGYWDQGDKKYVLKRNRIDCELTAKLYFKLLRTGSLSSGRGGFRLDYADAEDLLIIYGLMAQITPDEYQWRLDFHKGMRGDKRFNGIPYILHPDYRSDEASLFFCARCRRCGADTLVAAPNTSTLNSWLETLLCPRCKSTFDPPKKGYAIERGHPEFPARLAQFQEQEEETQRGRPWNRPQKPPRSFTEYDQCGSFEIIDWGRHWEETPYGVEARQRFTQMEKTLRRDLAQFVRPGATVAASWNRWHPSVDFWRERLIESSSIQASNAASEAERVDTYPLA